MGARLRGAARALRLCLMEARPSVQGVFVLRFAVGAAFATHGVVDPLRFGVGALAWWCAIFFAYLLNGITDVEEDRHNGSSRPIACGALTLRTATAAMLASAVLALVLACFVPGLVGWVAAFLALGWVYSAPPVSAKRGSVSCALVVFGLGWTSYAGGTTVAGNGLGTAAAVFATAMAAWMALVGSVVKDLSDAEGDAVAGRRTFAARHGSEAARRLAVAGTVVVGAGAPAAAAIGEPSVLPGTLPLAAGAVWVVVRCLRGRLSEQQDRHARRGAYRAFMVTQYVANAVMLGTLLVSP